MLSLTAAENSSRAAPSARRPARCTYAVIRRDAYAHYVRSSGDNMKYVVFYGFLAVLVAALHAEALSVPTGKSEEEKEVQTSENVPAAVLKRQTNFQNDNFNQQQIPEEYFDFIQQTDGMGSNQVQQPPPFGKQNDQQQNVFASGLTSDVFPSTITKTTTLSPFAAQQVQLQEDYARRTLTEQQTAFTRPRQRPIAQSISQELQVQPLSVPRKQPQQPQPLRFLDRDGQVRQQNFVVPQQQDFVPQQQDFVSLQQQDFVTPQQQDFVVSQQQDFVPQQQNFVASQQQDFVSQPRQQNVGPTQAEEAFSYAQVQFGPTTAATRSKGQRSVSKPRINQVVVEPITEQSVDYSSVTVRPKHFHLLQNVVYIQPNGQMYKPIEDAEPVVHIPRKNYYPQQQQWPIISDGPTIGASSTSTTTTAASPVEEEQVVLIPRPKKPNQQRSRHEGRKSGRAQQAARTESLNHPEYQIQQQQQQQQSSEVEPDNFLTSLLSRLQLQHQQQQQQQQETTVATIPKARGSQRSKGGNRSGASKYLPDMNQLQLLQFPHELKSLSTAELKALEEASVQIAEANDRSVVRQKLLQKNTPVSTTVADDAVTATATPTPAEVEELHESPRQLYGNNRPVPTPVQLNEQQRQFLASQGIRHLYRVDYDQSGNVLPLTYVLALDNRSKRTEQLQEQ